MNPSHDLIRRLQHKPETSVANFENQIKGLIQTVAEKNNITGAGNTGGGNNSRQTAHEALSVEITPEIEKIFLQSALPAESLNIISEVNNSVQQQGTNSDTKGATIRTCKNLVNLWMKFSCCAEALVRFSSSPANQAETANFSRNLFSLADNFHKQQEFPRFICQQVVEAVLLITKLIEQSQDDSPYEFHSSTLTSVLDRVFLRHYADEEQFYVYFDSEDLVTLRLGQSYKTKDDEYFVEFLAAAAQICDKNFITRRVVGKILLGLGQNSVNKVGKLIFLVECSSHGLVPASKLLFPSQEFLSSNQLWKRHLISSLPFKTRVENLTYFSKWSDFVITEASSTQVLETWKTITASWNQLLTNAFVDSKTVSTATCALVAFAKSLKAQYKEREPVLFSLEESFVATPIFQGVQRCLSSTDSNKSACGMVAGQVVADLLHCLGPSRKEPAPPPGNTGNIEKPTASGDIDKKLTFDSKDPFFLMCISYYANDSENGTISKTLPSLGEDCVRKILAPRNFYTNFDDLSEDSDDDVTENEDIRSDHNIDAEEFEPYDLSNDAHVSASVMNLKSLKKNIPNYFSEICETLMEAHGSKDEAAMESLKQIALLKIPLLLHQGVKIDVNVAADLARVLAELDGGSFLEIPVICGLYEIAQAHPEPVFRALSKTVFDKQHFSAGHRIIALARYSEITQLLSKRKCFSCFKEKTGKLFQTLEKIHPPFIRDYLLPIQSLKNKCESCNKEDAHEGPAVTVDDLSKTLDKNLTTATAELRKALTWREIVEARISAKTRRFASARKSRELYESPDVYSGKLVPLIWASLANKLMDYAPKLLVGEEDVEFMSSSMMVAQLFRTLGIVVLGTAGIYCPHFRSIAIQTADLVSIYCHHKDFQVRRAVLTLLALIITYSEGKQFILEIFLDEKHRFGNNISGNFFQDLESVFAKDDDAENRRLFTELFQLVTASALVQMGHLLNSST